MSQIVSRERALEQQTNALLTRGFDRAKCILPCGWGKTFLQNAARETVKARRTLVLAPFISLLAQSRLEFDKWSTKPFESYFACSDAGVSDDPQDVCSLQTFDLVNFLEQDIEEDLVVFCTYMSTPFIADCLRRFGNLPQFDLIIFDEAQSAFSNDAEAAFATAVDNHNIPAALRLFYTATERFTESNHGYSMDDEAVAGKAIVYITDAQAVEAGIVKPFEVITGTISTAYAQDLINNNKVIGAQSGNISAHSMANHVVLAKTLLAKNYNTCMMFHTRITDAIQSAADGNLVADQLGIGHIKHIAISSLDSVAGVREAFELLRSGNCVLHNVRIGIIGVNLPNLQSVFLATPKNSVNDIIQIKGRTSRKMNPEDCDPSSIIVPMISDNSRVIEGFKHMLSVLSRLANNIPLVAIHKGTSANTQPIGGDKKSVIKLLNCDETLSQEFLDAVQISIDSQFKHEHERRLFVERAKEYADYVGHHLEFPSTAGKSAALARWASKIRILESSGHLKEEQKQIVVDALPEFVWSKSKARGSTLSQKLAIAKVHLRIHGKHLPQKHDLAFWFRKLSRPSERRLFNISNEDWDQIELQLPGFLRAIGVVYENGLTSNMKDLFLRKIHAIKDYVGRNGHFPNSSDDLTLHTYRLRLNTEMNKGKFPERKLWLEKNWPQYWTTPSYAQAVTGRTDKKFYEQFERKIEDLMHLEAMPLRGEEGYGFCVLTKMRHDKGELAPYELSLIKGFAPWLLT